MAIPVSDLQKTIWEQWERDFAKAEMQKNKAKMERIWLKSFLTALRHWRDIDPPLRPIRFMELDHSYAISWGDGTDKDIRTDVISAWLAQMAEWSRKRRTQPDKFRR